MQRESPQIQLGESDSAAHVHWLNHYRYNSERSEEALAIAVQSGLTVFTLYKMFSGCVVCVLLLKL